MTDFTDPDQQKLDEQLEALNGLLERFQHLPKEVMASAKEAENNPNGPMSSEMLKQVWEGGLRDSVKKMTSYAQQAIALHAEFQSLLDMTQADAMRDAASMLAQTDQAVSINTTHDEDAFRKPQNAAQLEHVGEASHSANTPNRKKAKRFV